VSESKCKYMPLRNCGFKKLYGREPSEYICLTCLASFTNHYLIELNDRIRNTSLARELAELILSLKEGLNALAYAVGTHILLKHNSELDEVERRQVEEMTSNAKANLDDIKFLANEIAKRREKKQHQ